MRFNTFSCLLQHWVLTHGDGISLGLKLHIHRSLQIPCPSPAVSSQARGNFSSHQAISCPLGLDLKQIVFILQPNSKDLDGFSSRPLQLRAVEKEVDLSPHLREQITPEQGIGAVRNNHERVGYLAHTQVHDSLGSP